MACVSPRRIHRRIHIYERHRRLRYVVTKKEDFDEIQQRSKSTCEYNIAKVPSYCLICYEEHCGDSFFVITGCCHYFCKGCTKYYCDNLISEGKVAEIKCPDTR
mmetsp:Transcript_33510/g.38471  ORF Transcript_33510/g.38471 Transcript_33510/m.38471 type:complete len:104 (+) Transcript_33510:560-871(+)